jgi:4'-phosphopantetheinyl transferase
MHVTQVHIWLVTADQPPAALDHLESVLDDDERRRAGELAQPEHRRLFTVAHGVARLITARHLAIPAERVRWRHGPHGKPELSGDDTGLQVNLSHSGALAAVAVARHRPVGVDVQQLSSTVDPRRLSARFYPAAEARFVAAARPAQRLGRFTRLWARKEACVKAAGGQLWYGLALPVHHPSHGRSVSGLVVHDPAGALPGPFLVHDVPVPRGFHAAVAVEGDLPCRVSRHWWRAPHL